MKKLILIVTCLSSLQALVWTATGQARVIRYLSREEALPVIEESGDVTPPELASSTAASWDAWVRKADHGIRARLERGDEDSIVNLLLFGTSFTKEPRITGLQLDNIANQTSRPRSDLLRGLLAARTRDLVEALAKPAATDPRLSYARSHLVRATKANLATATGRKAATEFLASITQRMYGESQGYNDLIEQARRNQEDLFVVRSQMFARRGLSSDTQLKPNLAIENALSQLKQKGLLSKVRRVAIVGPGLDFTDKDEGYDFYPPQTLQPFAVIESLIKLGLADKSSVLVDTYDLSPKVNSHIQGFAARARRGETYPIILPLDKARKFTPEFIKFWKQFGSLIGSPAKAVDSGLGDVEVRGVNIRPEFLTKIHAYDTNIVAQSPELLEKDRYDLIIGTNIFLYYSPFEQGLAMRNLNKMLAVNGILLSNNALVEFPFTPIHSVGYTPTIYSEQKSDADAIVWYQKK